MLFDHLALLLRAVAGDQLEIGARGEEPGTPAQHERARRLACDVLDRGDQLAQQDDVHRVRGWPVHHQHGTPPSSVAQSNVLHDRGAYRAARGRGRLGRESDDGARGTRTPDLLGAIQALSQLSYSPVRGAGRRRERPEKCSRRTTRGARSMVWRRDGTARRSHTRTLGAQAP